MPVVFSAWRDEPDTGADRSLVERRATPCRARRERDAPARRARRTPSRTCRDATDATPLVILDQFEEHFLYAPRRRRRVRRRARALHRQPRGPARELPDLRPRGRLRAASATRFKARIPNVYGNYLHLDFLDEAAARRALVEPVAAFNERLRRRRAALRDRARARRRRARRGAARARRRSATTGRRTVRPAIRRARRDRLPAARDEAAVGRGVAAGSRRAARSRRCERLGGADTIVRGASRRRPGRAARRPARRRSGRVPLPRDVERQEDRAELGGAARVLRCRAGAAGAGARASGARAHPPAGPASEPDGVVRHEIYHDVLAPAMLDWRRRHAEERRRPRPSGAWRRLANARAASRCATAA